MNCLTLTGRLTNDPVRRDTSHGVVAVFRLAVDDRPHRLWIDVETWGRLAGVVATHLTRGRHVAVTGQLRDRHYHDRDGQQRHHIFVAADRVGFLDTPHSDEPVTDDEPQPAAAP